MKLELSLTEENYLKAIYHLSAGGVQEVSTTAISEAMDTKPATVSDMMRKLSNKKVIRYEKYKGANISEIGKSSALKIIRKHRLWEVFLVEKLHFKWDEVHEIAEQLEHVKSPVLVEKLDAYLGHPTVDPHGDPIPDSDGQFKVGPTLKLSDLDLEEVGVFVHVTDDNPTLLQHLDSVGLQLGDKIKAIEKISFDGSIKIVKDNQKEIFFSEQIASLLAVRKIV